MARMSASPEEFKDCIFFDPWPCDVFDANGNIVEEGGVFFDTETGVVIFNVKNGEGFVTNCGVIVRDIKVYPAPLTIVPYDPNNHVKPNIVVGN